MAEAAFFYNFSTQRPDRSKASPGHVNAPASSQTPPAKHTAIFKRSRSKSGSDTASGSNYNEPQSLRLTSAVSGLTSNESSGALDHTSMFPTPLPDYRLTANQSSKNRVQGHSTRGNSATSGSSLDRKNAPLHAVESKTISTARGELQGRSGSISSTVGSSGLTAAILSDAATTDGLLARPFVQRNGRQYLRDTSLPYPLPCDLNELHRQTLRTMLLCQVFNGPICSKAFETKPPRRVLEVGCGTGFWSVMCHTHFSRQGFTSISFTGIDIAPLASQIDYTESDMNWRFVQHDLRIVPLPFKDEEFSLIMIKDMSMVTPTTEMQQTLMDEYLRILKPGGVLEIWDGDHSLRLLLSHARSSSQEGIGKNEDEIQVHSNATGTYKLTQQTPLAAPQNQYLLEFNTWIAKALESRRLTSMPCTTIRPMLLQESETLVEIDSRRLAIPLGEVRWEREGVGGTFTQPGNGRVGGGKGKQMENGRRVLTSGQSALRRTALMTVVQMIDSLEPALREASGKGQDEWDRWQGDMMNDLLMNNGTSWGECLEVGAWWARKKKPS